MRAPLPRFPVFSPAMPLTTPGSLDEKLSGGRLTVDLDALADNWADPARQRSSAGRAAVVKADPYGIGLEPAASALARAGCKTFFVALPSEGLRLRDALPGVVIYVLDGLIEGSAKTYAEADLRPGLNSWDAVGAWAARREK